MHVGRHRHVHHFRVRQFQIVHQLDIFLGRAHLQPRIVALLLADGGDGIAFVIVGRKHHGFVGQFQQPAEDGFVLRPGAAVLEVGAAGAADQQRIAGEDAVAHQIAVGIVGMAGRVHHVETETLDHHLVAVGDPHRHHVGFALLAHDGDAMGAVAQLAQSGDVVGVQMGIDRLDQPQVELPEQLAVAVDLLQHRIEDQRLAAGAAGQQIAVGPGNTVEQLAKDHGRLLSYSSRIYLFYGRRIVDFCRYQSAPGARSRNRCGPGWRRGRPWRIPRPCRRRARRRRRCRRAGCRQLRSSARRPAWRHAAIERGRHPSGPT